MMITIQFHSWRWWLCNYLWKRGGGFMLAKTSNGVISARATTLSLSLAIVTIQRWWCDLYWWNVKDQYSLPPSQFQWKGVFVWGFGFNYPSFSLAKQFNFGDISRKSPRVSQGDGAGSKCYGILIKQVGYWFAFSPLMMKIYWLYVWLFWQTKSFMAIAHTWNKSNWGNMRVWPSTWSLPYHTVPLCIRIYMASPRLFPYFVYFAPIVFRGIVSMLIPAEIWGRRWGRITEGAICGSSSYQHHHQYHHFNHNIISIIIL